MAKLALFNSKFFNITSNKQFGAEFKRIKTALLLIDELLIEVQPLYGVNSIIIIHT
jgi:hypothetical protein